MIRNEWASIPGTNILRILSKHRKSRCSNLQSLFTCFLCGCGFDNRIQQLHLLFWRAIQFFDVLIDHICVDTGNTLWQFTLTLYGFRIMDNYIDWSTFSYDTTHLPRYFSLWERSCPLFPRCYACFATSKNGIFWYNIIGILRNFFRGIILSRICQRFIERGLSANWLLFWKEGCLWNI